MNMQTPPEDVELRIRSMRTLWIALILSILGYFAVTVFVQRPAEVEPNKTLSLALYAVAVSTTMLSFLIKSKLVSKAINEGQAAPVQQAYVAAWAITEAGALVGLLDYFKTSDPFYYVPFVIALCGQILQFPRREHVLNASFKSPGF